MRMHMYGQYTSGTSKGRARIYLLVFVVFLALVLYWRHKSASNESVPSSPSEVATEQSKSAVEQAKQQVNNVDNVKSLPNSTGASAANMTNKS